jgi:CRP/FNR family transcriptional regulator, cyclic AMP receptor protein
VWPPPLLADLPEEDVQRLLQASRRRTFARGEIMWNEGDLGDTLHFIMSGRIAVSVMSRYGQQLTFAVMGPGECVGELALLDSDRVRSATVKALEPTETRSIRRSDFEAARREHPGVNDVLVRILAARVARLSNRLQDALYVAVDTRVLRCVLEMAQLYGGAPGTVIPLTQDDLAGLAGTARATVNRVLRHEQGKGSLLLGRHRVTVLDPQGLAKRAELEETARPG